MTVIGPSGLKHWASEAWSFLGRMLGLRVIEIIDKDAAKPKQEIGLDSYIRERIKPDQASILIGKPLNLTEPDKVLFSDKRIYFDDQHMVVHPIEALNADGKVCFSYLCEPNQRNWNIDPERWNAVEGLSFKEH